MLFLIDSNIAIAGDPLSHQLEPDARAALEFFRLAHTHHHDVRTHPSSEVDFNRIGDPVKRAARLAVFQRYERLVAAPPLAEAQQAILGQPVASSNDEVDQLLLAAVVGDAVEYLVTNDEGLHRKARRVGVADRVLRLTDAVATLRALHADPPTPPPAVRRVKVHELDLNDPIFDSLKESYPGFADWFTLAARRQRDALLIDGDRRHAALAILKTEPTGEHGLRGPHRKISTFKVAEGYNGQKYGELLLKTIFEHAYQEQMAGLFVTLFPGQTALRTLLEDFGFAALDGVTTALGELVYEKPSGRCVENDLAPLDQHIRYGPPCLNLTTTQPFVVPIEPRWHRVLFPDAEPDDDALLPATLGLATQPFGNALRKAYLCNAPSRLLQPGDPLLFYRSSDERAVHVVGVCEATMISRDPVAIAARVGRRTVYSMADIALLAERSEVLVVVFRQDRILRANPIQLVELQEGGALRSWPQSITRVRPEGRAWLAQRLAG